MSSHYCSTRSRPATGRSRTWPAPSSAIAHPSTRTSTDDAAVHGLAKSPQPAFEDIIDQNPEHFYLPPVQMYDYEDWSSDSDDDDDDDNDQVAWSAGITDFALFDRDRQRARASGQALPEKWEHMLENQVSALDRAVERTRQDLTLQLLRTPSDENLPDLTPDGSPHLLDDMEIASSYQSSKTAPRPIIPAYLRSATSSPSVMMSRSLPDTAIHDEDANADLSYYVPRRTQSSPQMAKNRQLRPGLKDGRTLSGKEHVWRRPSFDIFTVREDPAAELRAEKGCLSSQGYDSQSDASRGRL